MDGKKTNTTQLHLLGGPAILYRVSKSDKHEPCEKNLKVRKNWLSEHKSVKILFFISCYAFFHFYCTFGTFLCTQSEKFSWAKQIPLRKSDSVKFEPYSKIIDAYTRPYDHQTKPVGPYNTI